MSEPTSDTPAAASPDEIRVEIRREDQKLPGGRTLRFKEATKRRFVPNRRRGGVKKALAALAAPPGAEAVEQPVVAYSAIVHHFSTAGGLIVRLWTTPAKDQLIGEVAGRDDEPSRDDVEAVRALFWPAGMAVVIDPVGGAGRRHYRIYNRRPRPAPAASST